MTEHDPLHSLAERYGVFASFHDLQGHENHASTETKIALLRGLGIAIEKPDQAEGLLKEIKAEDEGRILEREIIIAANQPTTLYCNRSIKWHLMLDGETKPSASGHTEDAIEIPALPSGIHSLFLKHDSLEQRTTILATPGKTPTLEERNEQNKIWGFTGALYGLQSERNFGLGDFQDLAQAVKALAGFDASFFGINPIHALGWANTETYSPYSPTHRGYLNCAHIALDHIKGLEFDQDAKRLLSDLKQQAKSAQPDDTVDYNVYYPAHKQALKTLYTIFQNSADKEARGAFAKYHATADESLKRFSLFEALSEDHGPDWHAWPDDLKSPHSQAAKAAQTQLDTRITFHMWLQWVASDQLAAAQVSAQTAGMTPGLYLDLAVGARRSGAEAWCESDIIAHGVSIGAPPDHLSPAGQNWGLTAHSPLKASQTQYKAFRKILSNIMRQCSIMRIDHVLGMNRSFWIPDDGSAGGYIKQPFESLLAVIAIEAERADVMIIGEDLGLVPDGFRDSLKQHGLYSYSVLQYEKDHTGAIRKPDHLAPQSLACFGTHDTPTLCGYLHGTDINWWQRLGWIDDDQANHAHNHRHYEVTSLIDEDIDRHDYDQVFAKVHDTLAHCPSAMVCIQLDDAFGSLEAQNLPSTIEQHPNWQRRYPVLVDAFPSIERLAKLQEIMKTSSRHSPTENKGQ